jgi:serine/threonine-protein kinase
LVRSGPDAAVYLLDPPPSADAAAPKGPFAVEVLAPERDAALGADDAGREARASEVAAEAQRWAALEHPAFARRYGLVWLDGALAMVSERVEGVELGRVAQVAGRIPAPEVMAIVEQVALALDHAFAGFDEGGRPFGLIHGGVDAAHLWLTPDGVVRVIDVGLARAARAVLGGQRGGARVTPGRFTAWPPPERAPEGPGSGEPSLPGDVHALGMTALALLVGGNLPEPPRDPSGYAAWLATRRADATERGVPAHVMALLLDLLAWEVRARPTLGQTALRAREAWERLGGHGLRTWSEGAVRPLLQLRRASPHLGPLSERAVELRALGSAPARPSIDTGMGESTPRAAGVSTARPPWSPAPTPRPDTPDGKPRARVEELVVAPDQGSAWAQVAKPEPRPAPRSVVNVPDHGAATWDGVVDLRAPPPLPPPRPQPTEAPPPTHLRDLLIAALVGVIAVLVWQVLQVEERMPAAAKVPAAPASVAASSQAAAPDANVFAANAPPDAPAGCVRTVVVAPGTYTLRVEREGGAVVGGRLPVSGHTAYRVTCAADGCTHEELGPATDGDAHLLFAGDFVRGQLTGHGVLTCVTPR